MRSQDGNHPEKYSKSLRDKIRAAQEQIRRAASKAAEIGRPELVRAAEVVDGMRQKIGPQARTAAAEARTVAAKSSRKVLELSRKTASDATNLLNAALASDFAVGLERWLGDRFNTGQASDYDKTVDAVYNASHIGGGQLHRLFDGSHTLWDMWEKVRDALPHDSFGQEVAGYFSALGKDLSSRVGLPIINMTPDSYEELANALSATFGVERLWFTDLLHVNAVELLSTVTCSLALALNWKRVEVAQFSNLAAGAGISSLASANPALAVVALVALAKSFMDAKARGDYSTIAQGLAKGGIGTSVFIASAAAIGGPAWVGIMAGMCASIAAQKATNRMDFASVSEFMAHSLRRALGPGMTPSGAL